MEQQKQNDNDVWTPQQLQSYRYDGEFLQQQITELWQDDNWQTDQQDHFLYNPDQQLVKSYQQQWASTENNWQDSEISEYIYQNDGKISAIKTAQWQATADTWKDKDYTAYVYKPDLPWLNEQVYLVRDYPENQWRSQYRWAYRYSQNILKLATYTYWDEVTKTWVESGRVEYHYDTDNQLTKLLFQEKTANNTWQDLTLCELFWGDLINAVTPIVAAPNFQCQYPNPYHLGDEIRYQGEGNQAPYTLMLYDYSGRQIHQQLWSSEGVSHLPQALPTAYYLLIVRDKEGHLQYQNKLLFTKG